MKILNIIIEYLNIHKFDGISPEQNICMGVKKEDIKKECYQCPEIINCVAGIIKYNEIDEYYIDNSLKEKEDK